jgi:hypothetical protein
MGPGKPVKEDTSNFLYTMDYDPPIPQRETDELILMVHSTADYVQPGAIYQARIELDKRGVTSDLSYSDLKSENFIIMAKQRLQMLLLGAVFWGIIIFLLMEII